MDNLKLFSLFAIRDNSVVSSFDFHLFRLPVINKNVAEYFALC